MKLLTAAAVALSALLSAPLYAQTNPVVVELFTSQGCSSCPPADALMHDLAKREDVMPLALHVDYWDYIGWKDKFARPANTDRQRGYAREGGRNMIYTPQMVINGQDDIVGARASELAKVISTHLAKKQVVELMADRQGDKVSINAHLKNGAIRKPLTIHLLRYTPRHRVDIKRGENAGRSLDYVNVVDDWSVLGEWRGNGPLKLETELKGDRPAVVLLQYAGPGAIVAAARAD